VEESGGWSALELAGSPLSQLSYRLVVTEMVGGPATAGVRSVCPAAKGGRLAIEIDRPLSPPLRGQDQTALEEAVHCNPMDLGRLPPRKRRSQGNFEDLPNRRPLMWYAAAASGHDSGEPG